MRGLGRPETDPDSKLPKVGTHDKNRPWPDNIKVAASGTDAIALSAAEPAPGAAVDPTASRAI
jgi:hypothetical protein